MPTSRQLPDDVEPFKIWQDAPHRCNHCPSRLRPIVTCELYGGDNIVLGVATCAKCRHRYVFTRHLTSNELRVPQQQGKPVRQWQESDLWG